MSESASPQIYVGIEQAVVLGGQHQVEGKLYTVQSDGCLKPIDGRELVELARAYPTFVKSWSLDRRDQR
jgi:hypothetical protein